MGARGMLVVCLFHGRGAKDHQAAENTENKEGLGSTQRQATNQSIYVYILPELSPKNLKPRGHAAGAAVICIAAASLYRADGPSKQHSCHHKANYGDEDAEEDEDELSTGDSSRSGISRHYRLRKKHKDLRKAKKSVPERSCQLRAACVRAASDSSVHEFAVEQVSRFLIATHRSQQSSPSQTRVLQESARLQGKAVPECSGLRKSRDTARVNSVLSSFSRISALKTTLDVSLAGLWPSPCAPLPHQQCLSHPDPQPPDQMNIACRVPTANLGRFGKNCWNLIAEELSKSDIEEPLTLFR